MKYNLVEIFHSIQGEGFNFGMETTFVRFSDCNLNCYWCDTDWKKANLYLDNQQILEFLKAHNAKNVIVTGGEPSKDSNMDKFIALTEFLLANNINVHVETNGLVDLRKTNDLFKKIWISTSPKIIYRSLYEKNGLINEADEVRIVIDPKIKFEKQIEAILWFKERINAKYWFLSPCEVDMKFDFDMLGKIYDHLTKVLNQKEWRISIQLHKLMNIR